MVAIPSAICTSTSSMMVKQEMQCVAPKKTVLGKVNAGCRVRVIDGTAASIGCLGPRALSKLAPPEATGHEN